MWGIGNWTIRMEERDGMLIIAVTHDKEQTLASEPQFTKDGGAVVCFKPESEIPADQIIRAR